MQFIILINRINHALPWPSEHEYSAQHCSRPGLSAGGAVKVGPHRRAAAARGGVLDRAEHAPVTGGPLAPV